MNDMSGVEFRFQHECPDPPKMFVEEEYTEITGKLWWKKEETKTRRVYEEREARWRCPACGAVYKYDIFYTRYGDDSYYGYKCGWKLWEEGRNIDQWLTPDKFKAEVAKKSRTFLDKALTKLG